MKKIKLTHGRTAIVDDEDHEWLSQWKWFFSAKGYAERTQYLGGGAKNEKSKRFLMHRVINNTPDGLETDHINRNKLDNRKCNLRSVTTAQNQINKLPQKNKVSKYKGVCWDKRAKKWKAQLIKNGERVLNSNFKNEKDAALAYNVKAYEFFGENAYLNEVA